MIPVASPMPSRAVTCLRKSALTWESYSSVVVLVVFINSSAGCAAFGIEVTSKSVATRKSFKVATRGGWMGPQCIRMHDVPSGCKAASKSVLGKFVVHGLVSERPQLRQNMKSRRS